MSYSVVPTVADGDVWTASQQNTNLKANMAAIWKGTTAGDMDYYTGATDKARLPIATLFGNILRANVGLTAPEWGIVLPQPASITSSATPTPDVSVCNVYDITALAAAATFGVPTGSPINGQKLLYRIKDNGTARALSWNAIYRGIGLTLPATTVISKWMYVGFCYNAADSKWDCPKAYALET